MKKSTFWVIIAAISIIFAVYYTVNHGVLQAMFGCTACCASLVVGAWYEREEREEKENH